MSHTYTVENDDRTRTVEYVDEGNGNVFIDIELTEKEGVDVVNAVEQLVNAPAEEQLDTDISLENLHNNVVGGVNRAEDTRVMVLSQDHAKALLHALVNHEPEQDDFTDRIRTDILAATEQAPQLFDVTPLREIR